MWQRWNSGTKIFEKSSDNGASWTPLGLDAAIITQGTFSPSVLGNVAIKDQPNTFTADQTVAANLKTQTGAKSGYLIFGSDGTQYLYSDAAGNFTFVGGALGVPGGLNASQLLSGTVPDARLSTNVLKVTGGFPGAPANFPPFLKGDGTFSALTNGVMQTFTTSNLTATIVSTGITVYFGVWAISIQGPTIGDTAGLFFFSNGGAGVGFTGSFAGPAGHGAYGMGPTYNVTMGGTGADPYIISVGGGDGLLKIQRNGAGTISGTTTVRVLRLL